MCIDSSSGIVLVLRMFKVWVQCVLLMLWVMWLMIGRCSSVWFQVSCWVGWCSRQCSVSSVSNDSSVSQGFVLCMMLFRFISSWVEKGRVCLRWINCLMIFGIMVESRMVIMLIVISVSMMGQIIVCSRWVWSCWCCLVQLVSWFSMLLRWLEVLLVVIMVQNSLLKQVGQVCIVFVSEWFLSILLCILVINVFSDGFLYCWVMVLSVFFSGILVVIRVVSWWVSRVKLLVLVCWVRDLLVYSCCVGLVVVIFSVSQFLFCSSWWVWWVELVC